MLKTITIMILLILTSLSALATLDMYNDYENGTFMKTPKHIKCDEVLIETQLLCFNEHLDIIKSKTIQIELNLYDYVGTTNEMLEEYCGDSYSKMTGATRTLEYKC